MTYWDDLSRHFAFEHFWMGDPRVRRRIGTLVSGDPACGYSLDWFARRMRDALPFPEALSIGSGTGSVERHLVSIGAVGAITGIDASPEAVAHAARAAAEAGMADRIAYAVADAHSALGGERRWDAIFFHGSLHHLDRLPELFRLLERALRPGGILFLDEYLGPSREAWGWGRLIVPNLAYRSLPRAVRRTRIVRAPVTDEDPSEMIRASEIAPLVGRHFDVVEWRDYGGNLVSLLFPNLRKPPAGDAAGQERFSRALERLFRMEDFLLRHPWLPSGRSLYAVVIARRR